MYRCQPHDFKTRILGRAFHTLTRNASFRSPTDVESHIQRLETVSQHQLAKRNIRRVDKLFASSCNHKVLLIMFLCLLLLLRFIQVTFLFVAFDCSIKHFFNTIFVWKTRIQKLRRCDITEYVAFNIFQRRVAKPVVFVQSLNFK